MADDTSELTDEDTYRIQSYQYQSIVKGITWEDIDKKVTAEELSFTLECYKLEQERIAEERKQDSKSGTK